MSYQAPLQQTNYHPTPQQCAPLCQGNVQSSAAPHKNDNQLNKSAPVFKMQRPVISVPKTIDEDEEIKEEDPKPLPPLSSISPSPSMPANRFFPQPLTPSTSTCNDMPSPVPVYAPMPVYLPQVLTPATYQFAIAMPFVPLSPVPVHVVPLNVIVNNYNYSPVFTFTQQQPQVDDAYSTCSDSSFSSGSAGPDQYPFEWPTVRPFVSKNKYNRAKGNFYISKDMIAKMVLLCKEDFITFKVNDEGLGFSYFKESVAISINDGQIHIVQSEQGEVIFIDIDLHFASNGQKMFLIAMENQGYAHKVKWCIVDFMTQAQIFERFRVNESYLPASSRNMQWFQDELRCAPLNVSMSILNKVRFAKLHQNRPKDGRQGKIIKISEADFGWYCQQSWNNGRVFPVVVIKNGDMGIEWKKVVQIGNDYVCISLKYDGVIGKWQIECIDYDFGRLYYRHRLVGLPENHAYNYSYAQVAECCTTELQFV